MNTQIVVFISSLCLAFVAQADYQESLARQKTKAFGESKFVLAAVAEAKSGGLSLHWAQSKRLLLGISGKKVSTLSRSKGGDLDSGKYFDTSSGYESNILMADVKYFFKEDGIQTQGWFAQGQVGRGWGRYTYSQDRYERYNGILGNVFLGIDKKLAETDSEEKQADANIARASIGYYIPWIDGNRLKGISIQLLGGLEATSLSKNQYLSTRWNTKNVGEYSNSMAFLEASIAAHF